MSLDDVARKLGVSNAAVSTWEHGRKPIPQKRLEQLSSIFDIPEEYFGEISEIQELEINGLILENEILISQEEYDDEQGNIHKEANPALVQLSYNDANLAKKKLLKRIESTINGNEIDDQVTVYDDITRMENYTKLYNSFTSLLDEAWTRGFIRKAVHALETSLNIVNDASFGEMEDEGDELIQEIVKIALEYRTLWEGRQAERKKIMKLWEEDDAFDNLYS